MTKADAIKALATALDDGTNLDKAARQLLDALAPKPKSWSLTGQPWRRSLTKKCMRPSPIVRAVFPDGSDVAFSCMTLRGHPEGFDREAAEKFAAEHYRYWHGKAPTDIRLSVLTYEDWHRWRLNRRADRLAAQIEKLMREKEAA